MSVHYEYSRAAGPQAGTAIHTTDAGLWTNRISVEATDGPLAAYVARPAEKSAGLPVVLVLSEAFGLHEHIADIARRFAQLGYLAIAPDLMGRQGDPMSFSDVPALVQDLLLKIPDRQVMADLDACVEWAVSQGANSSSIAASGFCWGGRWTWLYAAHRPLASAVAWYGILDGRANGMFPDDPERFPSHPIDLVSELKTPVLGLHGGADKAISMETITAMGKALESGEGFAKQSRMIVYPNAPHAFFADYRETYDPGVSGEAWAQCSAWIERHFASSP